VAHRTPLGAAIRAWLRNLLAICPMPSRGGRGDWLRCRHAPPPPHTHTRRPWIVAMTASAMNEDKARCFDAGMDDFLVRARVRVRVGVRGWMTSWCVRACTTTPRTHPPACTGCPTVHLTTMRLHVQAKPFQEAGLRHVLMRYVARRGTTHPLPEPAAAGAGAPPGMGGGSSGSGSGSATSHALPAKP
jgi:CheY-like chemotaxis protein